MYTAVQDNLIPNLSEIKTALNIFDDKVARVKANSGTNTITLDEVMFLNIGDYVTIQKQDYLVENINYVNKTVILRSDTVLPDFLLESPVYWHHQNHRFISLFNAATSTADVFLGNPFYALDENGNAVQAVPEAIKEWCMQYVSRYFNTNELGTVEKKSTQGELVFTDDLFHTIQFWRLHYVNADGNIDPAAITYSQNYEYAYVAGLKTLVKYGRYY